MPKLGADVDQLDRLAANLDRAAARLEDNASVIERQVRSLWWSGSTADRFAASWASTDRRHLSTIAAGIRDAAERVRSNALQQRMASSGMSIGGGSFGIAPEFGNRQDRDSAPDWVTDRSIVDGLRMIQAIAGIGDDVKAAYFATMIGLTNMGMFVHRGKAVFGYYRSAKGGFTTQLGKLSSKSGAVVTGAISTLDYAMQVARYGWSSPEAVSSSFDGLLSTGSALVPGGGLAYEGGKLIGDGLWKHTMLGDTILESSIAADIDQDLSAIHAAQDNAVRRGDFVEATRLSDLATAKVDEMQRETSGYKGLWNAGVGVAEGSVRTVVSWINPFG